VLSESEELQVKELLGYLRAFPLHLSPVGEQATKPVSVRKKPARPKSKSGTARLNLLMDAKLKEWVHRYAKKRRTTVTAIINQLLLELRDKERQ
jgi:hypothetical protein